MEHLQRTRQRDRDKAGMCVYACVVCVCVCLGHAAQKNGLCVRLVVGGGGALPDWV